MKQVTLNAIDIPDFMKKDRVRHPVKIEINWEELFLLIESFFEKHYKKLFIVTLLYLYGHVAARLLNT